MRPRAIAVLLAAYVATAAVLSLPGTARAKTAEDCDPWTTPCPDGCQKGDFIKVFPCCCTWEYGYMHLKICAEMECWKWHCTGGSCTEDDRYVERKNRTDHWYHTCAPYGNCLAW